MSAFHDDIQNLSAVLDSLHSGVCAFQQPVLRLVIDHLRLLASQGDPGCSAQTCPHSQTPPSTPAMPLHRIHTAWDLGMDDATAIWFFQVEPSGCWRIIDYYEASGEGLAHYAQILAAKARPAGQGVGQGDGQGGYSSPNHDASLAGRGFVYGTHIAPHDIRVRELGTGQSRWESAAQLGIRFSMAPPCPTAACCNRWASPRSRPSTRLLTRP